MQTRHRFPHALRSPALTFSLSLLIVPAIGLSAGEPWPRWETPEDAGFSSPAVAHAEELWQALPDAPIAALVMVYKGKILASFGNDSYPFWCHSVRKSLLSALFGRYVANGTIDLEMTLAELGIDDTIPLTEAEKQAKVVHLLKARSGIYIEAACEAPEMKAARPQRGSHPPDTFWYYNNWDFNALGTIFRQETGRDIFQDFQRRIAKKIGMEDFHPEWCSYQSEADLSMHPCYTFRMSTRDRARVGQLFLQGGRWGKRQVVPESWVSQSTDAYSWDSSVPGRGYGYMWWVYEPEFFQLFFEDPRLHTLRAFAASGYGGQAILALPDAEIVLAFGVDVYAGGDLDAFETAPTLEALLTAREIIDLELVRVRSTPRTVSTGDALRVVAKARNASSYRSLPTSIDFFLSPNRDLDGAWELGTVRLRDLAPGKRAKRKVTLELPTGIPAGSYFPIARIDGGKGNYDLDRTNNLRVGRRMTIE